MASPKILALSGSTREASFNQRLAVVGAAKALDAGADVTLVSLRDFPLPLFDEDLEARDGEPENAAKLKELFKTHDGILLASPEYNSSITAVLKNAIDWISRSTNDDPPLVAFTGKVVALMAASPGDLGGIRGLVTVRSILGNIGMVVLPTQVVVPKAHQSFGEDGSLQDEAIERRITRLAASLVDTTKKLHST